MADLTKKDAKEKMTNENKNMTNDDLAGLIQREFLNSNKKTQEGFSLIGERLDKVEDGTSYLRGWSDVIERRINEIKKQLDKVVYRSELERVEKRVAAIEKEIGIKQ